MWRLQTCKTSRHDKNIKITVRVLFNNLIEITMLTAMVTKSTGNHFLDFHFSCVPCFDFIYHLSHMSLENQNTTRHVLQHFQQFLDCNISGTKLSQDFNSYMSFFPINFYKNVWPENCLLCFKTNFFVWNIFHGS